MILDFTSTFLQHRDKIPNSKYSLIVFMLIKKVSYEIVISCKKKLLNDEHVIFKNQVLVVRTLFTKLT